MKLIKKKSVSSYSNLLPTSISVSSVGNSNFLVSDNNISITLNSSYEESIVLTAQPSDIVVLNLILSTDSSTVLSTNSIVFNTDNWNIPQYFSISTDLKTLNGIIYNKINISIDPNFD